MFFVSAERSFKIDDVVVHENVFIGKFDSLPDASEATRKFIADLPYQSRDQYKLYLNESFN